jgi:enoyl-CoA hydratase/carnithine racemase
LRSTAYALARELAEGPSLAFGYIKDNLDHALSSGLLESLDQEAENLVRAAQTSDHKEAVRAFVEKRKPSFGGR